MVLIMWMLWYCTDMYCFYDNPNNNIWGTQYCLTEYIDVLQCLWIFQRVSTISSSLYDTNTSCCNIEMLIGSVLAKWWCDCVIMDFVCDAEYDIDCWYMILWYLFYLLKRLYYLNSVFSKLPWSKFRLVKRQNFYNYNSEICEWVKVSWQSLPNSTAHTLW